MLTLRVFVICTVIFRKYGICDEETTEIASTSVSTVMSDTLKDDEEWISDGITNVVESFVPISDGVDLFEGRTMCRKHKKHQKHNKFIIPMLVGFLLIKAILLPVALKALAVLSGKAVVLSVMSLILAAIVGLRRVALAGAGPTGFSNDGYSKYRRKDHPLDDRNNFEDEDPYRYYREKRR